MVKKRVFFSFCFDDAAFMQTLNDSLATQPEIEIYFYPEHKSGSEWPDAIETSLKNCDAFVLFLGSRLGATQRAEARKAMAFNIKEKLVVLLPSAPRNQSLSAFLPTDLSEFQILDPIRVDTCDGIEKCARLIMERLGLKWDVFGIPEEYPFEYEKDIIEEYMKGKGGVSNEFVARGCPERWPDVDLKGGQRQNPVPEDVIGTYRDWDPKSLREKNPRVLVAALSDYHNTHSAGCPMDVGLSFAEAGPRKRHFFPQRGDNLTIGILVSGGIAPGLNSVLAGIIDRHQLYFNELGSNAATLKILCYREGFNSLIKRRGDGPDYQVFTLTTIMGEPDDRQKLRNLSQQSFRGGTIVPTARTPELMDSHNSTERREVFKKIVSSLEGDGVELLYIVGGDGSMRAAHAIQNCAREEKLNLSVVAVPKTMDNDILWVWQSFGFPSAVEWAKDAICHLHTEATSSPRLCLIQLFGSDSGFVVGHAALASGVCDLVLIPEIDFEIAPLVKYISDTLRPRYGRGINGRSPYGVILMSETAIPRTCKAFSPESKSGFALDDDEFDLSEPEKSAVRNFFAAKRRVKGKTPDSLRRAGLKIVLGAAKKAIKQLANEDPSYWRDFRVFISEPRHLLRAIPPSSSDILFARRLGTLAVDCAMAGYHDFMISQWLTEYVMVPLELVILGRKRVPRKGIFWKSVLASTRQPADMSDETHSQHEAKDIEPASR